MIQLADQDPENPITFAADDTNARFAVRITGKAVKAIEPRGIVTGTFLTI